MLARHRCNDGRKSRVHRNEQFGAGLLLFDVQGALADVLWPHADHIAAPLPSVEQQGHRQPCSGSYWMMPLELRDLVIGPTVEAVGLDAYGPHVARWIVGA